MANVGVEYQDEDVYGALEKNKNLKDHIKQKLGNAMVKLKKQRQILWRNA